MKKLSVKLIIVILGIFVSLPTFSYDYEYNGLYFDLEVATSTATLTYKNTSYNNYSGNIVVPEVFDGPKGVTYTVTSIGSNTFKNSTNLSSISLPNTVSEIGSGAFYGCRSLTSIILPQIVNKIGESAFCGCSSLTSINVPAKVSEIPASTFSGCSELLTMNVPSSITAIGQEAFKDCSKLTSIVIPATVTSIGSSAFKGCSSLSSANIPSLITVIKDNVFSGCTSLNSIELHDKITTIGAYAFQSCRSLSSLSIPASVASIGEQAFADSGIETLVYQDGCTTALRTYATRICSVSMPSTITQIPDRAFYDCSLLANVVLPSQLITIGESAFYNCKALTTMMIPANITSIGSKAFAESGIQTLGYKQGCKQALRTYASNIKTLILPYTITAFAPNAFAESRAIENIYIDDVEIWNYIFLKSQTNPFPSQHKLYVNGAQLSTLNADFGGTIANYAFSRCRGLKYVNLTSSVRSVGNYAFQECEELEAVAIGSQVQTIGTDAFSGCLSLESVRIGEGLQQINSRTFKGCLKLSSFQFGGKETSIGESAFEGCSLLPIAHIPNTVTVIGKYAFKGCQSLQSFVIPEGITTVKDETFNGCRSMKNVQLPVSLKDVGASAFRGCKGLKNMVIPDAVTNIGSYCYEGCDSLAYVHVGAEINSIGEYAFANCSLLTGFYCSNTQVPTCGKTAFENSDVKFIKLYVPDAVVSYYQNSSPWNTFGAIFGSSAAPVYVTDVSLTRSVVILPEGESAKINAICVPDNATNSKVNWTSGNTAVAYVNATGTVLANEEGTTTVTAKAADNNGASANGLVIVTNAFKPVNDITLSDSQMSIPEGRRRMLTYAMQPSNATYSEVAWTSSNPDVAIVNSVGVVTALKTGTADILCTASDGNGTFSKCTVTVTDAIDPTIGDANEDGDVSVTDIARAVETIIEGIKNGEDISIYDMNGDGQITSDDVMAIAAIIRGETQETTVKLFEFVKETYSLVLGDTKQIEYCIIPHRAENTIVWNSDNTDVATISATGEVHALSVGSCIIAASTQDGNLLATCEIKVKDTAEPDFRTVPFIENTGAANINLGYVFGNNTRVEIKAAVVRSNGDVIIGESDRSNDSNDLRFFLSGTTLYFDMGSGRLSYSSNSTTNAQPHVYELGNYYIKRDGTLLKSSSSRTLSRTQPLYLFGSSGDLTQVYYVKIYEGDTLVRDYVPCKDGDEYALYECVEGRMCNAEQPSCLTSQEIYNDHEYVDLGLPSGTLWATCNIGANSPEEYGQYFRWGSIVDIEISNDYPFFVKNAGQNWDIVSKYSTKDSYSSTGKADNKTILESCDDAASVLWGMDWRMPTVDDFTELRKCQWNWTKINNVNGYLITGYNGHQLFIPASGHSKWSATVKDQGSKCGLWSSSLYNGSFDQDNYAYGLYFTSSSITAADKIGRGDMMCIRPVLDSTNK